MQTTFLTNTLAPLLARTKAGEAVVYFADAAYFTHNIRATYVLTETSRKLLLLTVSIRELVNFNAALNAHYPSRVHLDETDCINV